MNFMDWFVLFVAIHAFGCGYATGHLIGWQKGFRMHSRSSHE